MRHNQEEPPTQLACLLQRHLQHALGTRRERNFYRDKTGAAPNDLLDLHTRILQVDAHALEHLGGDACRGRTKDLGTLTRLWELELELERELG
jgi:hypothetical protein